jgi:putative endonuclease
MTYEEGCGNVTLNLFQGLINVSMKQYFVYIITNTSNKVLYIGVTNNLDRRMYEHKNKVIDGFTKKYNLNKLVYYEITNDIESAISREKQLKNWHRDWKIKTIDDFNPTWKDLSIDAETSSA